MKSKLFLTTIVLSVISINPLFAFLVVQDPTAIANQVLQLVDSGSTLTSIVQDTQEAIRVGQKMYRGFKQVKDANGNVYDTMSAVMSNGMDAAGSVVSLTSDIFDYEYDKNKLSAAKTIANTGSELIQATEYNVDYSFKDGANGKGHWDKDTGEWIWDTNYSLKLPSTYDIQRTYRSVKTLAKTQENEFEKKRQELNEQKKRINERKSKLLEMAKDAGEDLSTNGAVQTGLLALSASEEAVRLGEETLSKTEEEYKEQLKEIAKQEQAHLLFASINESLMEEDTKIRKQRAINEAIRSKLNEK